MAKIMVRTARKDYTCGSCGTPIHPGDVYKWVKPGFRSKTKLIRCHRCQFKQSELTTSKMSAVYEALEDADNQLDAAVTLDEITNIMETAAGALTDTADEYEEADQNFGGGGNTDSAEKADNLHAAADELSSWQPEGDAGEPCEDHEENNEDCEACIELQNEFIREQIESAKEVIQGLSI
jgi:DNA-directed RNA polymerase subunit RPC12/RpoP